MISYVFLMGSGGLKQAVPQCGHLDWCTSKLGMKWPRNATTLEV